MSLYPKSLTSQPMKEKVSSMFRRFPSRDVSRVDIEQVMWWM